MEVHLAWLVSVCIVIWLRFLKQPDHLFSIITIFGDFDSTFALCVPTLGKYFQAGSGYEEADFGTIFWAWSATGRSTVLQRRCSLFSLGNGSGFSEFREQFWQQFWTGCFGRFVFSLATPHVPNEDLETEDSGGSAIDWFVVVRGMRALKKPHMLSFAWMDGPKVNLVIKKPVGCPLYGLVLLGSGVEHDFDGNMCCEEAMFSGAVARRCSSSSFGHCSGFWANWMGSSWTWCWRPVSAREQWALHSDGHSSRVYYVDTLIQLILDQQETADSLVCAFCHEETKGTLMALLTLSRTAILVLMWIWANGRVVLDAKMTDTGRISFSWCTAEYSF